MAAHQVYAVNIGDEFQLGNDSIRTIFSSPGLFVSNIITNVFAISALIFLAMLIYGGINIIIGAGKGGKAEFETGKKIITYAVAGMIIMLASFFIVQLIETVSGVSIL